MAKKGFFKPVNRQKYAGDPTKIVYRSSWELSFMSKLDLSPDVISWSSESVIVPYNDKSTGRVRRYFPDFVVKTKTATMMIEIKPKKETRPPKMDQGKNRAKAQQRYITEVMTFAKNVSKWESAKRYCEGRGWQFVVMTEEELGIKF